MKEIKRRMDESAEAFAERCEEMAETKGMTSDDIALAILQDCPDATRIGGMRQKIALAVTQAEERGRADMREKCWHTASGLRKAASGKETNYGKGMAQAALLIEDAISRIPTSSEGQQAEQSSDGSTSCPPPLPLR